MILNQHPVLKLLDESPWKCHLIGSRYVGVFDRDKSDYDFLVECSYSEWNREVEPWLKESGFVVVGTSGYGPDNNLHGSNVWTNNAYPGVPSVDVLPVTPEEADMRLRFFESMKEIGDKRGGLLAKALKQSLTWSNLWDCLRAMNP